MTKNQARKFSKYGFLLIAVLLLGYSSWRAHVGVNDPVSSLTPFSKMDLHEERNIEIAGKQLSVMLANSDQERERGLSERELLPPNTGMLFVFDNPAKYSFWMKDMQFSIDIIWISEDLKVVDIKEEATPESYPESFAPKEGAKYVLEVGAGFSKLNNLKIGDSVKFLTK